MVIPALVLADLGRQRKAAWEVLKLPVLSRFGSSAKHFSLWNEMRSNTIHTQITGWLTNKDLYNPALTRLALYRGTEVTVSLAHPKNLQLEIVIGEAVSHIVTYTESETSYLPSQLLHRANCLTIYQVWLILSDLQKALEDDR